MLSCQNSQLAEVLAHVKGTIEKYFPHSTHIAFGNFLFLRFISPAIVSPEGFGLANGKTNNSKQQQTTANNSKQQQTIANNNKQQQITANNSKQQNAIEQLSICSQQLSIMIPFQLLFHFNYYSMLIIIQFCCWLVLIFLFQWFNFVAD